MIYVFTSIWRCGAQDVFELREVPDISGLCAEVTEWTTELSVNLERSPTIVAVNQDKVMLVDKYFEWRNVRVATAIASASWVKVRLSFRSLNT